MSTILVIGEPGTGKSTAIENLDPATTVIISPNNKDLPFLGGDSLYSPEKKNRFIFSEFDQVGQVIDQVNKNAKHVKTLIIEDFTHLMSKKAMDDAGVKGYDKWTELAVKAFKKIVEVITGTSLRPDLDVVLIGHVTTTSDAAGNMEIGIQTPGKLMENMLKIPSYFNYVFHAWVDYDGDQPLYLFQTNRDNKRLAKTTKGMFPMFIANDYRAIFARIHAYKANKPGEAIVPAVK